MSPPPRYIRSKRWRHIRYLLSKEHIHLNPVIHPFQSSTTTFPFGHLQPPTTSSVGHSLNLQPNILPQTSLQISTTSSCSYTGPSRKPPSTANRHIHRRTSLSTFNLQLQPPHSHSGVSSELQLLISSLIHLFRPSKAPLFTSFNPQRQHSRSDAHLSTFDHHIPSQTSVRTSTTTSLLVHSFQPPTSKHHIHSHKLFLPQTLMATRAERDALRVCDFPHLSEPC